MQQLEMNLRTYTPRQSAIADLISVYARKRGRKGATIDAIKMLTTDILRSEQ